jgi:dTDP-4-dehydrorhamnose reductase
VRVAIIGANGQLGTDLCEAYDESGHTVVPITRAQMDVRDADAVRRTLESAEPALVVNTAAMHHVESCEADPASAFAVNAIGARTLAQASNELPFSLVHVSTDYVFDGAKGAPYVETDDALPLSVYGNSKLSGEHFIRATAPNHFIVRTSGLFGRAPCRAKPSGNFVQMMLRLAKERGEVRVVTDEYVTPTYTADLARQMVRLSESSAYGTYHATSQGETSWYDYAKTVFDLAGMSVKMHRASVADFPQKAPRPKYSVLDNAALRSRGLDIMPSWRDSIARYVATFS